jgi:hypothetical protein
LEVRKVLDRYSHRWQLVPAALLLGGLLAAFLIGGGAGTAAATAASGSSGPTGVSGPTTTTSTTTTTTTTAAPVTTVSQCIGELLPATATSNDPNLLNYKFHCDGQVTAYTLIVSRPGQAYNEIDDFNNTGNVIYPSTSEQSTTESFNCQGGIPGSGINCLTATAGTSADPWTFIEGQFDTSTPFCPTLPANPKPGTKPSQGAVAYLVVNDPTGEQEGPWLLAMTPKCPVVKAVPKPKPVKS